MDEIDMRDMDFQAILDIRPDSVEIEDIKIPESVENKIGRPNPDNTLSLYRYFGLPRPEMCDDGIVGDINSLLEILDGRYETPEEMIRIINRAEMEISRMYPNRRISRIVQYFKERV